MNAKIKLAAYAVLLILVAWFGWHFYTSYNAVARESAEAASSESPAPAPATVSTNSTNSVDSGVTNASATTNAGTNIVAASTNPAPAAPAPVTNAAAAAAPHHAMQGKMIGYMAAMIGALIGLGLLVAHDVTQYLGSAAVDALLDDRGEGMRDPEYERAEQAWADGKYLEAIEMMREFLKNHPREQYAALRIAEIYEKDLKNFLAAALEYEEILKKKLPAERWGWAAIHLCNLYSKLGQQDKTRALLQRVADQYPKTSAAKKARSRLGIAEPEEAMVAEERTGPAGDPGESRPKIEEAEQPEEEEAPSTPEPPKSNLPPGFRPKK